MTRTLFSISVASFAVLKKAGNPIVDNLDKLENYVIFDLDKFYE